MERIRNTSRSLLALRALRAAALAALVPLTFLISCGNSGGVPAEKTGYEIDRTFTRGPVDLRVAVSKKDITIADRIDLLVQTKARDGYIVDLPRFGDKLDQFGIVDYKSDPPKIEDDGTVVTSRTYKLEPFLSGTYKIPPMTATFHQQGDTLSHNVESDTLSVEVRSILPKDRADMDIKDISPPVSMPARRGWIYAVLAGLVVAAAGVLVFLRLRKRGKVQEKALPAHEVAFARLERLLAEGLAEAGRYAEFTERVSDILRHYIEDRFGLKAPERTTEEFIHEAGEGLPVDEGRKKLLADFLMHCDRVKFAAHEPSQEEVKRSFETCRDFIEATKKEEVEEEAA